MAGLPHSTNSGRAKVEIREVGPAVLKTNLRFREILSRKIKNRSGDHVRTITVLEGILLRIADDSLKGDIKSAAFLPNRYGSMVSGELQQSEISDDDREVLEAYAARVRSQKSGSNEP